MAAYTARIAMISGADVAIDHSASVNHTAVAASHATRCRADGITRQAVPAMRYEIADEFGKSVPHAVITTGLLRMTIAATAPAERPYRRRSSRYAGTTATSAST